MSSITTTIQSSSRTTLKADSSDSSSSQRPAQPQNSSSSQPQSQSQSQQQTTPATQQEEDLDIYDEIEIEDMTFDSTLQIYYYPCPCGDRFEIAIDALRDGEDIAVCPGCSLMVRVIFEVEDLKETEKG